ncbi:hypothetical protein DFQ27_005843 [Actinomortierella ambigua]|uniref:Cation-transporting P-type ATPase N-terminal domain-containing protein n=1 Tax=Actinomortierella ambigua TaxID=1343610 RepID=A0A9P6QM28_9FUNG|nr:hypothetical protein DFQ27_005843 [Actinomortierella ambigua]
MTTDKDQRKSLALVRTQTLERAQGNAAPIEFRTLSVHVTETQRSGKSLSKTGGKRGSSKTKAPKKKWFGLFGRQDESEDPDETEIEADYFSTIELHKLTIPELQLRFGSNETLGLEGSEAKRRLASHGPNKMDHRKPNLWKKLFWYIFGGFCSVLWIGVITFFLCWQPPLSNPPAPMFLALAILVMFVIFLQASFSAFQDFSTARVMASILDMIPAECLVKRDGQLVKIPATDLVVGDLVQMSLGNKVPADLRLVSCTADARFDRAVLTGESEAIEASTELTDDNFLESKNVAFMGTHLIQGSCVGMVILKGNDTLMGRINKLTNGRKEKKTIIQLEIKRFVRIIVCLTIFLATLILVVWAAFVYQQYPKFMPPVVLLSTLMGCVVAFIPEGMPHCVGLTLLMIAKRMRDNMVLPKSLATVETLGCVNIICSDKTGTLTENKMHVTNLAFLDAESTPEEAARKLKDQSHDQLPVPEDGASILSLRQLQMAALLCNNAKFDPETINKPVAERSIIGDATDSALLRFAEQISDTTDLSSCFERIFEIPFNSRNKWMMAVYQGSAAHPQVMKTLFGTKMISAPASITGDVSDTMLVFVKGAPDVLLRYCTSYLSSTSNRPETLTDAAKETLSTIQQAWSRRGQRVLMLCKGRYSPAAAAAAAQKMSEASAGAASSSAAASHNSQTDELIRQGLDELCILGLVGIMDPPRPEIKQTIAECRRAGARFFMVTGDFGLTAAAIAKQIGLYESATREPHTYENIMNGAPSKDNSDSRSTLSSLVEGLPAHEPGRPRFVEGTSLLLTGTDLNQLSPGEWDVVCTYEEIVFARTTPEQKLRIVNEFQRRDGVVAVTGDGVNDAPALKAADVGVAVVSGSDVAIEAADLILLAGFDSIPIAIRLGRVAFQNLQRVISYLLPAGSWSEIWPVLINTFFGTPLPLSAFLMIIICCFTDGFPCMSLIMDLEEFDLMVLPPRNAKKEHLITSKIYLHSYIFIGSLMTIFSNMLYFTYLKEYTGLGWYDLVFTYGDIDYSKALPGITAETIIPYLNTGYCVTFVALVILQWGNILSIRNRRTSVLQNNPFWGRRQNLWIFVGMAMSLGIALLVTEVPSIQTLMLTGSVPIKYWLLPFPCALGVILADEVRKVVVRAFPNSIIAKLAW